MNAKREFGELELTILKTFDHRGKKTVKEVVALLGGEDKYTTIMTVMNRMVEKGLLKREKIGLQYAYWIVSSKPSYFSRLKEKFFEAESASLAAYLIESGDITDSELVELEELIKKKKKERQ